jgi:cold shock CspA family protein
MIDRRIGFVRKFNHDRGFGFVRVLDGGKPARIDSFVPDVFLHIKELKMSGIERVETGDTLEFDMTDSLKGLVASKIELVR